MQENERPLIIVHNVTIWVLLVHLIHVLVHHEKIAGFALVRSEINIFFRSYFFLDFVPYFSVFLLAFTTFLRAIKIT